jgi:hypothetical protein
MECIGCENHHSQPSDGPMSGSKLITKPHTTVSFDNNYAGWRWLQATTTHEDKPALIGYEFQSLQKLFECVAQKKNARWNVIKR